MRIILSLLLFVSVLGCDSSESIKNAIASGKAIEEKNGKLVELIVKTDKFEVYSFYHGMQRIYVTVGGSDVQWTEVQNDGENQVEHKFNVPTVNNVR